MVSITGRSMSFLADEFASVRCDLFTAVFAEFHISKGKAVPLQAWSDPEGPRKLRLPHFMTTAQDGVEVVSLTHRPPLPPRNSPGTHFC